MPVRTLWGRLARRRWFVFAALASTVIPAVSLTLINDDLYRAEASMLLRRALVDDLSDSTPDTDATDVGARRVQNEISVLEGDIVASQVRIRLGLASAPRVDGSTAGSADVVVARVDASTPELAALLANTYIDAYIDVRTAQITRTADAATLQMQSWTADLQRQIAAVDAEIETSTLTVELDAKRTALIAEQTRIADDLGELRVQQALGFEPAEVVSAATRTERRVGPDLIYVIIAALASGLALGVLSAFAFDALDDTLRTVADVRRVAAIGPIVAVVPVDPSARQPPLALQRSNDPAAMAYRALRNQLAASDRAPHVVQLTGVVAGDGASTTAANLAVSYAEHGATVVLVDADLRAPRLHHVFAVDGSFGLVEALAAESIDMAALPLDERITLLAAGTVPADPREMLTGQRFSDLIVELRRRFDHVIIDTPPLALASDAALTCDLADAVVMVVRAGYSSRRKLQRAVSEFEDVGARIAGVVVNQAVDRRSIDRSRPAGP